MKLLFVDSYRHSAHPTTTFFERRHKNFKHKHNKQFPRLDTSRLALQGYVRCFQSSKLKARGFGSVSHLPHIWFYYLHGCWKRALPETPKTPEFCFAGRSLCMTILPDEPYCQFLNNLRERDEMFTAHAHAVRSGYCWQKQLWAWEAESQARFTDSTK